MPPGRRCPPRTAGPRSPASATFVGYVRPETDSPSRVATPVSINFTEAVTDPAAVQQAITVTAAEFPVPPLDDRCHREHIGPTLRALSSNLEGAPTPPTPYPKRHP
ncbi:Ig-like domain-containing protein [Streptomyces graminilatus]|uniref:Ig-like domain-containing protein n=1 Tax=Streptomyces graminilatus TaxID=1464070 RepID=UPI003BB0749C